MKMNEINQEFLKTPDKLWGTRSRKGLFGIEIELEGDVPADAPAGWEPHREGSIRGCEFVTAGPIAYQDIIPAVQRLKDHLKKVGNYDFRRHYRASTHFHLNVSTEPFIHIFGMQIVFAMIEGVMLRMAGPERDGNHFCISNMDCGDWGGHTANNIRCISRGNAHDFKLRGKYAALNIDPVSQLGSIEFRFFPSSLDPQEIHKWATWLFNLRQMVKNNDDKTYEDVFQRACESPLVFSQEIIPDIEIDKFPITRIEEAVAVGTENAYEALRVLKKELARTKTEKVVRPEVHDEVQIFDDPPLAAPQFNVNDLVMRAPPQMIRRRG